MNSYKLIAIDMDGTLLNRHNEISAENLNLLHQLIASNVKIAIATGRPTLGLEKYVSLLDFDFPAVTYNGAVISLIKDKKILFSQSLNIKDVDMIIRFGKEHNLSMCVWSNDTLYVFDAVDPFVCEYKNQFDANPVLIVDTNNVIEQGIVKILFLNASKVLESIEKILIPRLVETRTFFTSKRGNLEFINETVSKGNALIFLSKYYGFDLQETVAIGDSETDLPMITLAGLGIAMGNAVDNVKAVANFTTLSNDDDGVAYAIKSYIIKKENSANLLYEGVSKMFDLKVLNEKYNRSIKLAIEWLKKQQNDDGSIAWHENGAYYYRLIWTLAALGEVTVANKLLSWFRENVWEKGGFTKENVGDMCKFFSYVVGNIAIGAHLLGAYDISFGCLDVLKKNQYPNGGFANSDSELKPNGWQENWITAQSGMAYLLAGDIRTAIQAAEFIIDVWERQPDLPNKMYYCVNPFTNELVLSSDNPSISYVINSQEKRQCFWVPGLIAAFLGQLYLATNEKKFLTYAIKHQDFAQSCTEKQFEGVEVCKTGFGAAILYQITKEQRYLDWAIKVGEYFCNTQRQDGCWPDDRFNPSTIGKDIAITDQQALWLHYIVSVI